jgi:queuine tRNA-ribosyltransferase
VECVGRGIDIFDCALPTRVARNGALFTKTGRVDIENASFSDQKGPVDVDCNCYTCQHFSAGYLHHLFKSRELLAYRLATIHNLAFMSNLIHSIRTAILNDAFDTFRQSFLANYKTTNEETRLTQKKKWLETRSEIRFE